MHDTDDMELGQKQIENLINASCLQMFAHVFDKSLTNFFDTRMGQMGVNNFGPMMP